MKKFIKLFITALTLVVTCSCGEVEWADKNDYMFLGKDSFWVHGYIDGRGYDHYLQMTVTRWIIDGHEYMGVNAYTDPIHSPNCKACKEHRDSIYNETVNTIERYIDTKFDSLATVYGKKTNEVKTLVEKKAKEIKYYWDNPPIDYD